ncbi:MAG: ribosomal protein L7/L12, partial [Lachnospiraceae bacterium]|nr:ribosomal protein L7/L12 [Lachnospiraceae bacterium]
MFYCVMLLGVGQNKIQTIKVYRELTGAGLAEAKRDVENAPIKVIGGLSENEAHDVSAALRQLGNTTSVEVDNESIIPNSTLQNYDVFEAVKSSVTDYSDPWDKPKKSKKADK